MIKRVKINGTWVSRIWDATDEEAARTGQAIERAADYRKNSRKRPAKTALVTGPSLEAARKRHLGV